MKRSGFRNQSYEEKLAKAQKATQRRVERQKLAPNKRRKTRKTTSTSKLRRKRGEWSTATADQYFSIEIRDRDGKCLKCGTTENLTCSHFHRRGHSGTRYCHINCIALCSKCHQEWEGPTKEYKEFMLVRLGVEKYLELDMKAARIVERKQAVAEYKKHYELSRL